MNQEGKKPGEEASSKTATSSVPITQEIKAHMVKVEAFQSKAHEAEGLLTEAEQLLNKLTRAYEDKEREVQGKEKIIEGLTEEIGTLKRERLELLEKHLEEGKQQLNGVQKAQSTNATTIENLKKNIEILEEQLRDEKLKNKNGQQNSLGAGKVAGTMAVLLVLIFAAFWISKNSHWVEESVPGRIVTGRKRTEAHSTPINSLITDSVVIKKYREYTESSSLVRVLNILPIGNQQVASICEKEGSGFVLKQIAFEGDRISIVSSPIDTFGDGRQKNGFVPCVIPVT